MMSTPTKNINSQTTEQDFEPLSTELFNIPSTTKVPFVPNTTESSQDTFWLNNPNILVQSMDFFPTESMTMNERLNALTRLILVLSLVGYLLTWKITVLFSGAVILAVIVLFSILATAPVSSSVEGFTEPDTTAAAAASAVESPSQTNPYGNVLLTDYEENPDKLPAPIPSTEESALMKQTVNYLHPDMVNMSEKLFRGLGDDMTHDQSLRQFYSNPSTTIPNDQEAFAQFCFGGMTSCKEGNDFACVQYTNRHSMV